MSEPIIRDAFTYGAGSGEPSDAMWLHIRTAIAARRQRRLWWRRAAMAAAAVLVMAIGGVAAVPGARAAVVETVKGWVTVWQGRVGDQEAVLAWATQQEWAEMERQGWSMSTGPWTKFGTVADAAALVGFQPYEAQFPGAVRYAVEAKREPFGDAAEWRGVTIIYHVGSDPYRVVTLADYRLVAGTWVLRPYTELDGLLVDSKPPTNPRTVDLGFAQALCYQYPAPHPDTLCQWLSEGRGVAVQGPDPETVIEMAKSLAK